MDKYYVTPERSEELKKELETLKGEKRREIADELKRAKEYGDLSENSEYVEAKEKQSRIETRIFELEEIFKHVALIQKSDVADTVQVGATVTLKKGGEILKYTIVGSSEANPAEGKISNESPLGRAFLGHKVGDTISVKTPGGNVDYQVTKLE